MTHIKKNLSSIGTKLGVWAFTLTFLLAAFIVIDIYNVNQARAISTWSSLLLKGKHSSTMIRTTVERLNQNPKPAQRERLTADLRNYIEQLDSYFLKAKELSLLKAISYIPDGTLHGTINVFQRRWEEHHKPSLDIILGLIEENRLDAIGNRLHHFLDDFTGHIDQYIAQTQTPIFEGFRNARLLQRTALFLISLLLLFVFLKGRDISKRLNRLSRVADIIASGSTDQRANIKGYDEIASLSAAFNLMASKLIHSKDYAYNIINHIEEMLIVVGPNGRIKEINEATIRKLGFQKEELLNRTLDKMLGPDETTSPLNKLNTQKDDTDLTTSLRTKDGGSIPVTLYGTEMKHPTLKEKTVLLVMKDMSLYSDLEKEAQKRALAEASAYDAQEKTEEILALNEEILQSQERIIHSNELNTLSEMAEGIRLELNEPVSKILSTSRKINEECNPNCSRLNCSTEKRIKIQNLTKHIIKILRALQNYSRDGSFDPYEITPVKKIVADSLLLLKGRMRNEHIKLQVEKIPKELSIECRPTQIIQALMKLIQNAHDALAPTDKPWIKIEVTEEEHTVCISVTDNGPGVPAAARERIFQPFYTTKGVGHGTGLGLSTANAIVQTHQGTLYLDENYPHTRFVMQLPHKLEIHHPKVA